jgi:hypothetical protein
MDAILPSKMPQMTPFSRFVDLNKTFRSFLQLMTAILRLFAPLGTLFSPQKRPK